MTTAYPETNAEVIEKALYCLKHGETESVENWIDLLRERLTTDKSRADALTEAVTLTIDTIGRQLDLIAERAPGNFLDKVPVVRSLTAHKKRLEKALAAVEQHEAAPTEVTADWGGDFERKARVGGFNLSREETGGDYCHDGSAAAWLWYYSGRLDQACSAAQPAPSAPLEGTGNGADERAAWFSAVMNAAASLEDAANWLTDPDSKRIIEGSAAFARKRANELWSVRAPRTEVAGAVPEGWKLVPIEPTDEMITAGIAKGDSEFYGDALVRAEVRSDYQAMIDAAPAPVRYQILTEDGGWLDVPREYYERFKSDTTLTRVAPLGFVQEPCAHDESSIEKHFDDYGFYLHGFEEEDREAFFQAALALVNAPQPPSGDTAAAPADCAHDYVRSDHVCIECGEQPGHPTADERASFDYDDVVSICDAHGICLPVDCVEMVVDIVKLSGLLPAGAAASQPAAAAGQEAVAHILPRDLEALRTYSQQCQVVLYREPRKTRVPLYTAPPAQVATRQGLTDGQRAACAVAADLAAANGLNSIADDLRELFLDGDKHE